MLSGIWCYVCLCVVRRLLLDVDVFFCVVDVVNVVIGSLGLSAVVCCCCS